MTSLLKESLENFSTISMRLPSFPALPVTEHQARHIEQKHGPGTPPEPFELDAIYKNFINAVETGNWETLTFRDWRNSGYTLWHDLPEYEGKFLILEDSFWEKYYEWLLKQKSTRAWEQLIFSYLKNYRKHNDHKKTYQRLSGWINALLNQRNLPRGLTAWKERNDRFRLFGDSFNASPAAEFFQNSDGDWDNFTTTLGLTGELSTNGYIEIIAKDLLGTLKKNGKDLNQEIRSFFISSGSLRFESNDLRVGLIEALLLPWAESGKNPDKAYRKELQDWLLLYFKDPRLKRNRDNGWRHISQDALATIFRWLTDTTIREFLEIIDDSALEQQWKARKKFWGAYLDQEYIDEAWVAFGADAKRLARQAFGDNFETGEIEGSAGKDQSVLLLRIREIVFTVWSHNGRCRAWHIDNKFCPKLYVTKPEKYNAADLRKPSMQIIATQQEGIIQRGNWQDPLAEFIKRYTTVKVSRNAYTL